MTSEKAEPDLLGKKLSIMKKNNSDKRSMGFFEPNLDRIPTPSQKVKVPTFDNIGELPVKERK